ncbi:DNA polymerase alpha subunit B [Zostera marina]|uniref:DNA polymerase alpha subunit B n=1 Tax=Zostera marina TaxID=29655 RepID=A0A0K9PWZ1_ZOSMR|nr:DNA polymerase alpha subunit B [Zostera marina]
MDVHIKAEFEKSGFSLHQEEEILQKCLTYCINFTLTPSDLVSYWEVYYLNRQLNGLTVENDDLDGFLSQLQNEHKESIIKEDSQLHVYSSNDVDMLLNTEVEHDNNVQECFLSSPINQYETSQLDSYNSPASNLGTIERPSSTGKLSKFISNHTTPFGQRSNKFVSLFSLNNDEDIESGTKVKNLEDSEDDIIRRVRPSERCSLQIHCSQPEPGCRFMYDRTEDKCNALENRIQRCHVQFSASEQYGMPTSATLASEKSIFAVGMICCDSEGRLNEKSILLQGSIEHSGGERVRLDLRKLPQFSFYPGQVIGIEGQNPSGHCFIATKVVDSLPSAPYTGLPPAKRPALDLENIKAPTSKILSVVIAAGPFTTTDNLLFEPLAELLAYASRKQPQLLVLIGPFVDSEHPEIKKGTIDVTFDDIYTVEVLRRLKDFLEYMGPAIRVVLVPSIRDANHDFSFPQSAFDFNIDTSHQITCLSNPCIFSANEIMFGCTSTDIMKHLSSEEISRIPSNSPSRDRMSRLATHVLNQHSFYPLYPPSTAVPLDLSLAPKALEIPSVPDILLLPSDLAPFAKRVPVGETIQVEEASKCMCVNPGRLAKGIGGGSFAEMHFNGNPEKTNVCIIRI